MKKSSNRCVFYQIKESQLHNKFRERFNAKVRAVIAWLGMEFKLATFTQVATYFDRDISNISRLLNKKIESIKNEVASIKQIIQNATTQA